MSKRGGDLFREIARWDWVITPAGGVLHHVADWHRVDDVEWTATGRTSCGLVGRVTIPGLLSRMGLSRCKRCCDKLSWPRGIGSPKNDPALRPLVETT